MSQRKREVTIDQDGYGETAELSAASTGVYVTVHEEREDGEGTRKRQYLVKSATVFDTFLRFDRPYSDGERPLSLVAHLRRFLHYDSDGLDKPTRSTRRFSSLDCDGVIDPQRELFIRVQSEGIVERAKSAYWQGYARGADIDDVELCRVVADYPSRQYDEDDRRRTGVGRFFDDDLLFEFGEWFLETWQVPSNRSNALFPIGEWGTTTGSYVATVADFEAKACPECGEQQVDTRVTVSTSHSTRTPSKYKCDPEKGGCGRQYEGRITG